MEFMKGNRECKSSEIFRSNILKKMPKCFDVTNLDCSLLIVLAMGTIKHCDITALLGVFFRKQTNKQQNLMKLRCPAEPDTKSTSPYTLLLNKYHSVTEF